MITKIMPIILHKNSTKVMALALGYGAWFFCAGYQWVTKEYTVPICFYETDNRDIESIQEVVIKISGNRKEMHHVRSSDLAIHIDTSIYSDGKHEILLNSTNLFLPESLKLVELIPSFISLNIQSNSKNNEQTNNLS